MLVKTQARLNIGKRKFLYLSVRKTRKKPRDIQKQQTGRQQKKDNHCQLELIENSNSERNPIV